ncbi:hypothetical protein FQA39_LY13896 [Lamprigera yunnana]|nr:hypothetical protein FQA39_LY13896 [Lamprigera yunnana]
MLDYNPAVEARLLKYNNASNEVLVVATRYAFDGDADKYIEMGYSTYLNLKPVIQIRDGCGNFSSVGCQAFLNKNSVLLTIEEWKTLMGLESYLANQFFYNSIEMQYILEQSFKDDLSVRNISRSGDISTDVKIYYNWEHTKRLTSPMTRTMSTAARNREDFLKTVNLYRDYQTCTFNRYDMENIFCLKPIIEYRSEVMQSRKLKEFYNNLVECVIVKKSKCEEIRRMAAAAVGDVNVVLDKNEIDLKRRIQRVRDSISKKFGILKRQRADAKREFGDTYRPIIEPLAEENKEARGEQRKKKKMAARNLNSDGESSESGNISRDIKMPSLPTTPIRSYPSPGLKRWLSALTLPSLFSPSILLMSQRQKLSPSSSSSSSDLIHQKYRSLPRQYIEKLFADGTGQTVDFCYGIHYDSQENNWAMGSSFVAMDNKDLLIDGQRYMGTPGLYEPIFMKTPNMVSEQNFGCCKRT